MMAEAALTMEIAAADANGPGDDEEEDDDEEDEEEEEEEEEGEFSKTSD